MKRRGRLSMALVVCLLLPSPASAYVGPGSGISAIGSALALVMGILLTIIGFVWYPIKRLFRRISTRHKVRTSASDLR
jgi:hypothetical protein